MKRRILILSNSTEESDRIIGNALALSNDQASKAAPEWIEIPFGQHDHKEAMQVVDKASAQEMLSNFRTDKTEAGKRFKGLPIFLGHADDPKMAGPNPDKKARGWIREMEIGNDCLRLKTDWNPLGRREVEGEEVAYFSPRWGVKKIANTTRNFRPVHLISIALTNDPNIGVMPLTNEKTTPMKLTPEIRKKLGLAEDASPEICNARIDQFLNNAKEPAGDDKPTLPPWIHEVAGTDPGTASEDDVKSALQAHAAAHKTIADVKAAQAKTQKAHETLDAAHRALQLKIANEKPMFTITDKGDGTCDVVLVAESADGGLDITTANVKINEILAKARHDAEEILANERKVLAPIVAEKAVREGRLRVKDAPARIEALCNAKDFPQEVTALGNAAVVVPVNVALQTTKLGERKQGADNLQGQVLTLVNERMEKKKESYEDAWAAVKKEHKSLFEQMQQPAKS